jgi:hypothetical protein
VEHPVEAGLRREHLGRVVDRRPHERGLRRYRHRVARAQVVEHDHFVAGVEEHPADDAADVSGAAGDEQFHVVPSLIGPKYWPQYSTRFEQK